MTYFGTSAPFLLACRKAGLVPREIADLSRAARARLDRRAAAARGVRLGVRGRRRPAAAAVAVRRHRRVHRLRRRGAAAAGVPRARSPAACLGAKVEAYDPQGKPVVGELGELVITAPMPSMPVGFWDDPDGRAVPGGVLRRLPRRVAARRLDHDHRARHLRDHRPVGRDAQPGRRAAGHGEFYSVVEGLDEVVDSVVVHLEDPAGGAGELLLFVVLADGVRARRRAAQADRRASCVRRCRRGTSRTRSTRSAPCRAR